MMFGLICPNCARPALPVAVLVTNRGLVWVPLPMIALTPTSPPETARTTRTRTSAGRFMRAT